MEDEKKTTFGDRLEMAFRKLIRLIGNLIIIVGVAAAIYFGTPFLYEKLVMPIEDNTARLSEIDGDLETSTDLLTRQISDLQSRQIEFENLLTENTNDMTEMSNQIQILEQEIDAHNQTLSQLDDIQDALDALESSSADYETFLEQKEFTLDVLQRQIVISRSVELLSRARLFLSQNNYDQSKKDVQAARDLLIILTAEIPIDEDTVLQSVINRLDLAVQNLPAFPVIAVDDVDIAWELLVNGSPFQIDYLDNQNYPVETPGPIKEPTPTETP